MATSPHEPPWFVLNPDGTLLSFSAVPDRLLEHPDLRERGLVPVAPFKPGVIYRTGTTETPEYVIKILDTRTQEGPIYEYLLQDTSPRNHTVPGQLTKNGHPLLIMPMLATISMLYYPPWTLSDLLQVYFQLVEGLEFLHAHKIAHLDLCLGNVLVAHPSEADAYEKVVSGKVYLIDFGQSLKFELGPGEQTAIKLPESQMEKPDGLESLDPFSWDVYCLGQVLKKILEENYQRPPPRVVSWYIQWLIGNERGCSTVCRCRPTAHRARQILSVIRSFMAVVAICEGAIRVMWRTVGREQ